MVLLSRFFYLRLPFPSGRTVVDERDSFPDESIQGFLELVNEPVTSSWALSAFIYAIALLHPIEMEDGKISSLRDGATESDRQRFVPDRSPRLIRRLHPRMLRLNKQLSFISIHSSSLASYGRLV